jgi:hypothetical protein
MSSTSIEPVSITDPQGKKVIIQTTLYDLIASINETIPPEEDDLVTAAVTRLLDTGRVSFR